MSTDGLPDAPHELCLCCMSMIQAHTEASDEILTALARCGSIEERAAVCHDLRGLVCPLSAAAAIREGNSSGRLYRSIKRTVDIIGGLIGSAIVFALLPLVAVMVKIQSPGPIFFVQERVGLGGKPFRLYKFRTMHAKAGQEARWAGEEEDRIFGFGAFMRRFHIDEFPQFFNVLRGTMSLVGPRPEQVPIAMRLSEKIPNYDSRHCVLPGLAGLSQMRYGYAGSELMSWLKTACDLYYIRHRSLWLDLSVPIRTIPVLLATRQQAGGTHADRDRSRVLMKPTA